MIGRPAVSGQERSGHERSRQGRSRRGRALVATLPAALLIAIVAPATVAHAAGPGTRTPGKSVPAVTQLSHSSNGGTNPKLGNVPSTTKLGTPNAGVVPVLGSVKAKADDGAYVLYESQVSPTVVDLMVNSPALGGYAPVRVQLPAGYAKSSPTTYPVLYLLHGGNDVDDYQSWSLDSPEATFLASKPVLVVMPSIGSAAYATNYFNYGFGSMGGSQYDTFVATELPQLLQRGYHAGTAASVAGISSGGYSALELAARHQGEYGAVAAYSGLLDTQLPAVAQSIEFGPLLEFEAPAAMWGDPYLNLWEWSANNPAANPTQLKSTRVFVSSGNGSAGPLDVAGTSDVLEPLTLTATQSFVSDLTSAGVPVTADLYGPGEHTWQYWYRELQRSWPMLAAGMGVSP